MIKHLCTQCYRIVDEHETVSSPLNAITESSYKTMASAKSSSAETSKAIPPKRSANI